MLCRAWRLHVIVQGRAERAGLGQLNQQSRGQTQQQKLVPGFALAPRALGLLFPCQKSCVRMPLVDTLSYVQQSRRQSLGFPRPWLRGHSLRMEGEAARGWAAGWERGGGVDKGGAPPAPSHAERSCIDADKHRAVQCRCPVRDSGRAFCGRKEYAHSMHHPSWRLKQIKRSSWHG